MRSWVFRNRRRLETLLGKTPAPPAPREGQQRPARNPRLVVLQPVRRVGGAAR